MKILVPVRYPVGKNSRKTLERAAEVAEERKEDNPTLVVLHVNLFQNGRKIKRNQLRKEVDDKFDKPDFPVSYVVREGFIIENSILEEAARQEADIVVIGKSRRGKLRRTIRRLIGNDPNIDRYLRKRLDTEIVIAE